METDRPNILFVCGRNQWRSPTAARLYANDQRINVRSVGMSPRSNRRISSADIEWADLVLVMERKYKARLLGTFRDLDLPVIESLEIPDTYQYMDEELLQLIREGTEFCLRSRLGIEPTAGSDGFSC